MKKKLSVTEYADLRGFSRQYVLKCLADKVSLYGIQKSEKIGKTWVLTLNKTYYDELSIQASQRFEGGKKK